MSETNISIFLLHRKFLNLNMTLLVKMPINLNFPTFNTYFFFLQKMLRWRQVWMWLLESVVSDIVCNIIIFV